MTLKSSLDKRSLALLAIWLLLNTGCGGSNPNGRVAVSGNVTLDGMPIDAGTIEFTAVSGKFGSGGKIAAGSYSLPADKGLPPGEYIVRITSPTIPPAPTSDIPKIPGMEPADVHLGKERVHTRFNSKSELKLTVPADTGSISQDFAVTGG